MDMHNSLEPIAADSAARLVSCPSCGKEVIWNSSSRYRPFCSARCKGIDFGAWAAEDYCLAGTQTQLPDTLE